MSTAVLAGACRHRQERALIDRFFGAARLDDRTALGSMATVPFAPNVQGIVREFSIEKVTPEERSGDLATKSVTVRAQVAQPDGRTVGKTMFLTLQRRGGEPWKITGVTTLAR